MVHRPRGRDPSWQAGRLPTCQLLMAAPYRLRRSGNPFFRSRWTRSGLLDFVSLRVRFAHLKGVPRAPCTLMLVRGSGRGLRPHLKDRRWGALPRWGEASLGGSPVFS